MPNPVDIISKSRNRIAKVAAIRAFVYALVPALTALLLAVVLDLIADNTWQVYGYVLYPERADLLSDAMVIAAGTCLVVGVVRAIFAYRGADDFMGAAGQIDQKLDGHEEIVTLATLANPANLDDGRSRRSPLFPVLWRHAIAYFEGFDPKLEFQLEVGEPIRRSSLFAVALAGLMVLATLGLARPPTPAMVEAARLNKIAREIQNSAAGPADVALAFRVRAAAAALTDPRLPPEEKIKRLQEVMREIETEQNQKKNQEASAGAKGSNSGAGKSPDLSARGESKGEGKGQGSGGAQTTGVEKGNESKDNNGSNSGNGKSGNDKNASKDKNGSRDNSGSASNDKNKDNGDKDAKQSIELQNELKKAQAQIEMASAENKPASPAGANNQNGSGPKPGENPNGNGGGDRLNQNAAGKIPQSMQGAKNNSPAENPRDNPDQGSHLGDTHLGETPAARNYQRFLKPGEKGDSIDIRDARYVMFRLPNAIPSAGSGKTVLDTERPTASTPYANVPLAPTSDDAPPDERQLVPPRYRELIH